MAMALLLVAAADDDGTAAAPNDDMLVFVTVKMVRTVSLSSEDGYFDIFGGNFWIDNRFAII